MLNLINFVTAYPVELHVARGNKQVVSGIRMRSGDPLTLQLSVASAAVPGLPSLARGKNYQLTDCVEQ